MAIDRIMFRGARPLRKDDREHLVGRTRDLNELCNRCESYDVVQITAPSGVGKTSFVTAGGRQALEARGFFVPPMKPWPSWLGDRRLRNLDVSAEDYAHVLYRLLIGAPDDALERDERHIADVVESVAGERKMVVMLDQMEELLRFQEDVGNALLNIAGEAAKESSVPHVVIARSEYRHRLQPVERHGAKVWDLKLNEITSSSAIGQIITQPVRAAGAQIDDDAVETIRSWWRNARDNTVRSLGSSADPLGAVGLLHLQALLWSFEQWALQSQEFDTISLDALTAFAASRGVTLEPGSAASGRAGASLMAGAISNYVEDRIGRATVRPTVKRDDSEHELEWRNGPRVMLARVAPGLSSGGYKVPQALSSLVPLALSEELTQRGARNLADVIRARGDIRALAPDTRLEGAGLAAGWDKARLLVEMVDSLESILQALSDEEANLLRKFNVTDEPVYELVHDGVGPALTNWSLNFLDSPISAIGVIAAQRGGAFLHSLDPSTFLDEDGVVAPHWGAVAVDAAADGSCIATLDDVQWSSNIIAAAGDSALALSDLCFRNGDFTGAAFVGCSLTNVSFERCGFKGTAMLGCALNGVTFEPAADSGEDLNLLTIKNPAATSSVRFVGLADTRGLFLEDLAGGEWVLDGCRLSHLVVTANAAVVLKLRGTSVKHMTVVGPVTVDADADSEQENFSDT